MDQQLCTGLASRIREVRQDYYGPHGVQFMADALDLPRGTWANYERGVIIPADVILKLIDATGVSPHWLLTGRGAKYPARTHADSRQAAVAGAGEQCPDPRPS